VAIFNLRDLRVSAVNAFNDHERGSEMRKASSILIIRLAGAIILGCGLSVTQAEPQSSLQQEINRGKQ
jgi:hypothetical protein